MIILYIYLAIAGVHLLVVGASVLDVDNEFEIDNFWDAVIWSILWIKMPIKALFKRLTKW